MAEFMFLKFDEPPVKTEYTEIGNHGTENTKPVSMFPWAMRQMTGKKL